MRLFWMVMRYKDEALQQHPFINERNVFHLGPVGQRNEITQILFPSLAQAERYAATLAQSYPTETIIVLEQKSVFELPELPAPIKKKFNSSGELVPDA